MSVAATIARVKLPVEQPAEWFKDGLQFECTGCGNCCTGGPGYIWMSDEEITRMAEHLKLGRTDFLRRYCRKVDGKISIKEKMPNARGEYDCIFLQEVPAEGGAGDKVQHTKRICTVYSVRPLQCRTWPFWEGILADPRGWKAAAKRCQGIDAGRTWSPQQIAARRDVKDWPKE